MTLKHLPWEGEKRPLFGAFDVETVGLGGEFILATTIREGDEEAIVHYTPDSLLDYMLANRKYLWFAHNAEYDWLYVMPEVTRYMEEYNIEPRVRGIGKVYEISFYKKDVKKTRPLFRMRDSMAVFPATLKKFAENFSSREKMDIGLADGVMFDKDNLAHVEYAKRDTEVLLESLINFDAMIYEKYHIHIKGTIAGTALKGWQRFLQPGVLEEPEERYYKLDNEQMNAFLKRGYFGGIVYVSHLSQYIPKVQTYDINSSYPNVMCKFGVPYGGSTFCDLPDWESEGKPPAFLEVDVDADGVPDSDIHFIGARTKQGVIWARGQFNTVITSREYEAGLAAGYRFDVKKVLMFRECVFPFNGFIEQCKELRKKYKGQAPEQIAKLMQNSLYGKFGMNENGIEYKVSVDQPGDDWRMMTTYSEDGNIIDASELYIWERDVVREADCMLPHWAAWITANARLELVNAVHIVGNNFLYADTDSVTVLPAGAELLEKSGLVNKIEYGGFKDEGFKYDWICRAPKFYTWRYEDGKIGYRAKGIPKSLLDKSAEMREQLHAGELGQVEFLSVNGVLQAQKQNRRALVRKRKPTQTKNLQSWEVTEDCRFAVPKRLILGNAA